MLDQLHPIKKLISSLSSPSTIFIGTAVHIFMLSIIPAKCFLRIYRNDFITPLHFTLFVLSSSVHYKKTTLFLRLQTLLNTLVNVTKYLCQCLCKCQKYLRRQKPIPALQDAFTIVCQTLSEVLAPADPRPIPAFPIVPSLSTQGNSNFLVVVIKCSQLMSCDLLIIND